MSTYEFEDLDREAEARNDAVREEDDKPVGWDGEDAE